jgi:DtxR family transcriptional regulator, Mn-dependent transcriptional regulator
VVANGSLAMVLASAGVTGWVLPVLLVVGSAVALLVLLSHRSMPIGKKLQARRDRNEQRFWEDILRQILLRAQQGQSTSEESLAGALEQPIATIRRMLSRMSRYGLIEIHGTDLQLTDYGKQWAIHVLRAHRLWESYLADEARVPLEQLHRQAEEEEHRLSPTEVNALDAQLGHPVEDPHGDPIPTVAGEFRTNRGTLLARWHQSPGGDAVFTADVEAKDSVADDEGHGKDAALTLRVVHVEDEPAGLCARLLRENVRPGAHLRVLRSSSQGLYVQVNGKLALLAPELLASVEVEPHPADWAHDETVARLSDLPTGAEAKVVALSDSVRGFSRRRLMDFGVTAGARVQPVLDNPFGDPRAYRVRGATIGIRREQADQVWVRPLSREAECPVVTMAEGQQ